MSSVQPATEILHEAAECTEMTTDQSPRDLRIVRITSDNTFGHSHIYMEAPVFTPDGRRFIYQRIELDPARGVADRRWREYWLCDIEDNFALRQLTTDPYAIGPVVSPDGQFMYYFINSFEPEDQKPIQLRRVDLQTYADEEVMTIDKPMPGTSALPSRLYVLSTIRADGKAVAAGAFVGDGKGPGTWCVFSCDFDRSSAQVVIEGTSHYNPHMQYARTTDPTRMHDLLIQRNNGVKTHPDKRAADFVSGCTLDVIRDDGTNFRKVPCGGGIETVHGHQEWRGDGSTILVGVDHRPADRPHSRPMIEATPLPADPSDPTPPIELPGAESARNEITRNYERPAFGHSAIDITGRLFVGDDRLSDGPAEDTRIFIGLLDGERDAALKLTYLLHPRTSYVADQATHPHPFLSPDGRRVFFNSDYHGAQHIYMAEGFEYPE